MLFSVNYFIKLRNIFLNRTHHRRTTPPFAKTFSETIKPQARKTAPSRIPRGFTRASGHLRLPQRLTCVTLRLLRGTHSPQLRTACIYNPGRCARMNHGESPALNTRSSTNQRNIAALSLMRRKAQPRLRNHVRRLFCRSPSPPKSRRTRRQKKQKQITQIQNL